MAVWEASLVGQSSALQAVRGQIEEAARSLTVTVLAHGESGTGKALIARAIHAASARPRAPFVNVTCAAVRDALLRTELLGILELARGGTVLFDELGDMSQALQAELLRVLEARTFRSLDGTCDLPLEVRIVACTHQDLDGLLEAGRFRKDLLARLSAVTIEVPPLRERREDIAPLTDHFLACLARELAREVKGVAEAAREKLRAYDWPGNVRELRGVIERAVLFAPTPALCADDVVLGRAGSRRYGPAR
jgi:DNA-binding NtrC family response regulator